MPLREYACDDCEVVTEHLITGEYPPEAPCELCGEPAYFVWSTCAYKVTNAWARKMQNLHGKYGNPYRNEDGSPKGDPNPHQIPHVAGPKTKKLWRDTEKAETAYYKKKFEGKKAPKDFQDFWKNKRKRKL